mgnify:FL=1
MKKVIVITGVGKGFGKDLFLNLVRDYFVIGISRSQSDIDRLQTECDRLGLSEFDLVACDVTNFEELEALLSKSLVAKKEYLWGIINNAGIRSRKPFLELDIEEFQNVSNVNLFSPIKLTQLLLPQLLKNGGGRVINISSILSKQSMSELSAYSVSKGGLDAFTRSLAVEFGASNVTCNSILPGFCKTSYFENFKKNDTLYKMTLDKTPLKRWGEAGELIGLCRLLLSSDGAYINGASIPVDGGWLA